MNNIIAELLVSEESDVDSSDSDEMEEFLFMIEEDLLLGQQRNTIRNFVEEVVPGYSCNEFISHFRVGRTLAYGLVEKFGQWPGYQALIAIDNTKACISPEKHILTFLWFAGHQTACFRDVADRFDMSISSLHSVTLRVVDFLCNLAPQLISWPNAEEKQRTKAFYLNRKGFPDMIGSIDGCHIKIDKPSTRGDDYVNRHNYPSIVLQGICNEERKFIDIFVGYAGSVHDARVFRHSFIHDSLEQLCEGGYLLGDSAYPNLSVLLTPYRDNGHLNRMERNFNVKLSSCRISIEHTFGMLKQRFRQLYHLKLKGHMRICQFIKACCVLHNVADQQDLIILADEQNPADPDHQPNGPQRDHGDHPNGNLIRDDVARRLEARQ